MDMPASLPFSKAFDFASGAIAERFQNPFWKFTELVWGAPLRDAVEEVKSFGVAIVREAVHKKDRPSPMRQDTNGTYPLLNNLINSLLDHLDDHQVVADAAMNYLSAGMSESRCQTFLQPDLPQRERHHSPIVNLDRIRPHAPPDYNRKHPFGADRYFS